MDRWLKTVLKSGDTWGHAPVSPVRWYGGQCVCVCWVAVVLMLCASCRKLDDMLDACESVASDVLSCHHSLLGFAAVGRAGLYEAHQRAPSGAPGVVTGEDAGDRQTSPVSQEMELTSFLEKRVLTWSSRIPRPWSCWPFQPQHCPCTWCGCRPLLSPLLMLTHDKRKIKYWGKPFFTDVWAFHLSLAIQNPFDNICICKF